MPKKVHNRVDPECPRHFPENSFAAMQHHEEDPRRLRLSEKRLPGSKTEGIGDYWAWQRAVQQEQGHHENKCPGAAQLAKATAEEDVPASGVGSFFGSQSLKSKQHDEKVAPGKLLPQFALDRWKCTNVGPNSGISQSMRGGAQR
jgi:hypothetical protein